MNKYEQAAIEVMEAFDLPQEERDIKLAALQMKAEVEGYGETTRKLIQRLEKKDKELDNAYKKEMAVASSDIALARKSDGGVQPTIENFLLIMQNSDKYANVRYNLLLNAPEVQNADGTIRKWSDADEAASKLYIEKEYHMHNESKHSDALRLFWKSREYHPIQDIVDNLQWDGVNRIEHFLTEWAKADDTPYVHEVSRLIFAGGIWRLYQPGCKFDDVPVLVGTKQGEGKSSLVKWLAINDSFFGEVTTIEGTPAIEQLEGAWICEIAELFAVTKVKEQEAVKSYITRQRDKFRKPFDKNPAEYPRRCIFIGTTNSEQFLKDKTGNRRWYPVTVHSNGYDLYAHEQECRDYIIQCWAEAKARYDKGDFYNFADASLEAEYRKAQEAAMEDDWRIGAIGKLLDPMKKDSQVCIREITHRALSPNPDFPKDPTPKDAREIGQILAKNFPEWKSVGVRRTVDYGRQKCWEKQCDPDESALLNINEIKVASD